MKRDYYAGALISFIGVFMGFYALHYNIGNLRNIGPGMLPLALSIILFALGILIALNAGEPAGEGAHDHLDPSAPKIPDLKGGLAIVLGMVAFVGITNYLWVDLAAFACVFIAAMGDKDAHWRSAFALALLMAFVCVVLFIGGLKMNLAVSPPGQVVLDLSNLIVGKIVDVVNFIATKLSAVWSQLSLRQSS